jgi:nitrous oxide reductase
MYSNHKASRKVSRRVVLGTAGVGVLGAAGAATGIAFIGQDSKGSTSSSQALSAANAEPGAMDGPVVIYVSGNEVRAYLGETEHVTENKDMADQLRQQAKNIS